VEQLAAAASIFRAVRRAVTGSSSFSTGLFAVNPRIGSNRSNAPSFGVQYFALVYMAIHPGVDF
jgi:hypothetical protein